MLIEFIFFALACLAAVLGILFKFSLLGIDIEDENDKSTAVFVSFSIAFVILLILFFVCLGYITKYRMKLGLGKLSSKVSPKGKFL